jgi:hypothetical protein
MTDPITPPRELAQQWLLEAHYKEAPPGTCPDTRILIARAAQWGADQELEACIANIHTMCGKDRADWLRLMRRPKPPSLKEQALEMLENAWEGGHINNNAAQTIRRALEALPE